MKAIAEMTLIVVLALSFFILLFYTALYFSIDDKLKDCKVELDLKENAINTTLR